MIRQATQGGYPMTISTNEWGDTSTPGEPGAGPAYVQTPAQPSAPARWARSPNVLDRPTLQGVMVLPAEGAAVVLTGTAARVWQALNRPGAGDELVGRLAPGRGDRPSEQEVAAALGQLQAMGAVRRI
jgi:hypothetical protein